MTEIDYLDRPTKSLVDNLRERINFSTENLIEPENYYVCWFDVMGAGNQMATSMHKVANFIAKMHLAIDTACTGYKFTGRRFAVNDGVYLISSQKEEILNVIRYSMVLLAANFLGRPAPAHRSFVRASVAYGPIHSGKNLSSLLSSTRRRNGGDSCLSNIVFGPPIIQAYKAESESAPFGVAIHESARAFSPPGTSPFQISHWPWWWNNDDKTIKKPCPETVVPIKRALHKAILEQLEWIRNNEIFQGVSEDKIKSYVKLTNQYFSIDRK